MAEDGTSWYIERSCLKKKETKQKERIFLQMGNEISLEWTRRQRRKTQQLRELGASRGVKDQGLFYR